MSAEEDLGVVYQTEVYENVTFFATDEPLTLATEPPVKASSPVAVNITVLSAYAIIFFLAVVGNSLVIVTLIQNKRMRSVTNVFLLSLSISDLLFVCVCMPFTLVGNTLHNFIFGPFMCKLVWYTQMVSVAVSVWTMVAIALERYHAICDPLASRAWQTKSRALKIIALIWVAAAIFGLPDLIATQLELYDEENMKHKCRPQWGHIMKVAHPFYLFTFLMVLPLICLFFAYGLIILELWRGIMSVKRATAREKDENGTPMKDMRHVTSTTSPDTNANDPLMKNSKAIYRPQSGKVATRNMGPVRSTSSNNAKKRVVRMLIVLVILFFIAWTPTWIMNIWYAVNPSKAYSILGKVPQVILATRLLSYISACINPIVYCFMNRSFRNGFLEVFKCCRKRYRPVNEDTKHPHGVGTATTKTRMNHPPDSTTNYTNVSSGEED